MPPQTATAKAAATKTVLDASQHRVKTLELALKAAEEEAKQKTEKLETDLTTAQADKNQALLRAQKASAFQHDAEKRLRRPSKSRARPRSRGRARAIGNLTESAVN